MENSVRSNIARLQSDLFGSFHLSAGARAALGDESVVLPNSRVFRGTTAEGDIAVTKVGPFPRESFGWRAAVVPDITREPISVLFAGSGCWIRGCEVSRRGSRICSIEMVTAGDAWYMQEGKRFLLRPGQVFLLHPGLNHSYGVGPSGYLYKRFVNVGGRLLEPLLASLGLHDCDLLSPKLPGEAQRQLKRIKELTLARGSRHRRKTGAALYELLLLLSEFGDTTDYPRELRQAMECLQNDTRRQWSRDDLCAAVGVNPTALHRLFSRHLQTTPLKYCMDLKIREAMTMLQSSTLPVKQIAMNLGFPDPLYFSKVFSRHTGMSPTNFRRKRIT